MDVKSDSSYVGMTKKSPSQTLNKPIVKDIYDNDNGGGKHQHCRRAYFDDRFDCIGVLLNHRPNAKKMR
jgi:hypothetical protein